MIQATVAFDFSGLVLGASIRGELAFITDPKTTTASSADYAFVDARTWPPTIRRHSGMAFAVARSASGRWLVYASGPGGGPCALRWFDDSAALHPTTVQPDPIPARDFTEAHAAHAATQAMMPEYLRSSFGPSSQRIETVHIIGEQPIVLPMHVGFDDAYRQPLIERDGAWVAITDLPPSEKSVADLSQAAPSEHVQLADGTDALAWHGCLYGYRGGRFEQSYDDAFDHDRYRRENIVPSPNGGVFVIDGATLVEIGPSGRRVRLPERRVTRARVGPAGTVIVKLQDGPGAHLLFDPVRDTIVNLAPLLGVGASVIGATDDALIVLDPKSLGRIPFEAVASLPTEIASDLPRHQVPPLDLFDDNGVRSRARIAASGTQIVIGHGRQVRHFDVDRPVGFVELTAQVVAVARRPDRAAALDASGALHVLDGVRRLSSSHVTAAPRTLVATPAGGWLVVGGDASAIVDPDGHRREPIAFAGGVAAAIDPGGAIVIVGEDRRLGLFEAGVLLDLPGSAEQVIAIAALGDRRFACAGVSNLFVLDLANPELELWVESYTGAHLAATGSRIVFAFANKAYVVEERGTQPHELIAFERMLTPRLGADNHSTDVCGLAYLDDAQFVVGVSLGVGKIVDLASRDHGKCLDPHPGDPEIEYMFTEGAGFFRWNSTEAAAGL